MDKTKTVDVLVIGAGINGAGIARDLSGRGISVLLCDKGDIASATSSASTKLIHGGLRYLEQKKFRLVRESLKEREILMKAAPYLVCPLTFVLPHHDDLRPWWMVRLGLFIYDYLGGKRGLPASSSIDLGGTAFSQALKPTYYRGFTYADCSTDDARLVLLCAIDAHEKGAQVMTRTECTKLEPHVDGGWTAILHDHLNDKEMHVHAQVVVNAGGPWVNKVLSCIGGGGVERHKLRWVKGSHIIVRQLYKGDHAYILQNDDKRIVFTIPYEGKYTLIGTTDVDYTGDLDAVRIDADEAAYLCKAVSRYFRHPINVEDIEWVYSGVRPLLGDSEGNASTVTREYLLDEADYQGAKIINVYGGKLTTFRKLAEQVADKVTGMLGRGRSAWTEDALMPGAEGANTNLDVFQKALWREYAWLPAGQAFRYAQTYGTRARDFLRGAQRIEDLGVHLGDGVYMAEIDYLVHVEWARTAEDVLWRRTKLGLHVSDATRDNVAQAVEFSVSQREQN